MLQREKYGHIPDQAQHGKAQAVDGGDAMNACKLQCNIYNMQWNVCKCNIYNECRQYAQYTSDA